MKSTIATNRGQMHRQLAQAATSADEAQELINRQRTRVHMLHQYGYNTKVAQEELTQLVQLQTLHKEDRDRLRAELANNV